MATLTARHGGLLATLAWNLQPLLGSPIRIEEEANGCAFVVRAEVAGIDPGDISVMVADGELKIDVDRVERHPDCRHSEFRYGRFTRTVRLPAQAREDQVTAVCGGGILEVTVGLDRPAPIGRAVRIAVRDDATPPDPVVPAVRRTTRPRGREAPADRRSRLAR
jgi:HSP20 family molecular chaperone IbpA